MKDKIFSNREEMLGLSLKVTVSEPNSCFQRQPHFRKTNVVLTKTAVNLIRALRLGVLLNLLPNLALQDLIGCHGMSWGTDQRMLRFPTLVDSFTNLLFGKELLLHLPF